MSQFSGKQYRGAKRVLKELKREEAEQRQAEHRARMEVLARLSEVPGEVISLEEVQQVIEDLKEAGIKMVPPNENPGPVLPGLAKRNRKVRGVVRNQRKAE